MAQIKQSSSGDANPNLNTSGSGVGSNPGAKIRIGSQSQAPVNARRLVADIVAQRLADERRAGIRLKNFEHVALDEVGPTVQFTNSLNTAIALAREAGPTKPAAVLNHSALNELLLDMLENSPPLDTRSLQVGEKLSVIRNIIADAHEKEPDQQRKKALQETSFLFTAVVEHTMRLLPKQLKKPFAKSMTDDYSKAQLYMVIKDLSADKVEAVLADSKGLQQLLGLCDPDSLNRRRNSERVRLGLPLTAYEPGPAIAFGIVHSKKPSHQTRGWQQLQTMLRGQGGNPPAMPAPIGPSNRQRFEQQEWQLAKTLSTLAQGLPGMTPAMQQTVLATIGQRIGDLTLPTRGLVLLDLLECNLPAFQNQIHRLANRHLEAITSAVPYMDTVQLEQAAVHLRRAMAAVPAVNSEQLLTYAFTLMGEAGRLSDREKRNLYLQLPAILGRLDDLGAMAPATQKKIMDMAQALVTSNNALLTNNQGSGLDNMVKKLFEVRATLDPAIQGQVNMICAPHVERLLAPAVLATLPDNTKQAMIPLLKARLLQPRGESVSALLKEIIGALPAYTLPHDALWQPMWAMLEPHLKHLTDLHAGQAAARIPANLNALAAGQRDAALAKLIMALTRGTVQQPLKAAMIDCVTGQLSGPSTPMAQLPYSAAALAGTLKSIKEATLQLKIVNTFDTEIPKITDLDIRGRIKASVAAAVPYLRNDDNKHALQIKAFNTAFNKLNELKTADQEQVLLPLAQGWRQLGTSDMRQKMTAEIAARLPELAKRDAHDPQLVTTLCDSLTNATIPQSERDQLACALIRNSNTLGAAGRGAILQATEAFLDTDNGLMALAKNALQSDVPAVQQQTVLGIIRNRLGSLSLHDGPRRDLAIQLLTLRDQLKDDTLKTAVDAIAQPYLEIWLLKIDELQPEQQTTLVNAAVQRLVKNNAPADVKMALALAFTKIRPTDLEGIIASIRAHLQKSGNKDSDAAVLTWTALAHAIPELPAATTIGIVKAIGPATQDLNGDRRVTVLSALGELWDKLIDPDCKNALASLLTSPPLQNASKAREERERQPGRLVFGIEKDEFGQGREWYIRYGPFKQQKSTEPIANRIDDYRVLAQEQRKEQLASDEAQFVSTLRQHDKYKTAVNAPETNEAVRRKVKGGLYWALKVARKQVDFVLDGIDMKSVVLKKL